MGWSRPVIALTANAMKGYERELIEAGFSHYHSKPIDIGALTALLAELLGGESVADPDVANPEPPAVHGEPDASSRSHDKPDTETRVTLHPDGLSNSSCAPDTSVTSTLWDADVRFHAIVTRFVQRLEEQLVAMRAAYERGDTGELASLAHWLKGSGGNVGFDGFTEPAADLERLAHGGDAEGMLATLETIERYAQRIEICSDSGPGTGRRAA